ncbi:MAG: tRNA pseudouridine(13) synthase TruD [Gammaproteobacteria bacterium]|nr:tRNA pseudouridine(13) synthase TruD [Gammaproteobacteria bacterium]NNC96522.1 tRNA pseudouridine(13) synthase TruD [Gammaproteobacteria bacterium]NNM13026.1 tRNA pseudouridine(13) synthase TruD [Gammaproteobacteria bacterium]
MNQFATAQGAPKLISPYKEFCGHADFKKFPQDFTVDEMPSYTPCGKGEHVWLHIRKTGANTAWVSEQLATWSDIKIRDISYAGRKDKQAVTTQWFSIYDPKRKCDGKEFAIPGCELLTCSRHTHKLRPGNLVGNQFAIVLRDFHGDKQLLQQRILDIASNGFPNYFGPQRFGYQSKNLAKATHWVQQGGKRIRREQRSLYFSVLRSFLFNLILAERVKSKNWNKVLDGEVIQLDGSKSVFLYDGQSETKESIDQRCEILDLHPTAPLFGKGEMWAVAEAGKYEKLIAQTYSVIVEFLGQHAQLARRALRVIPNNMSMQEHDNNVVLSFSLPAGCYASVLVELLVTVKTD